MSIDPAIFQPSTIGTFIGGMMATASIAGAVATLAPRIAGRMVPRIRNSRLSDIIPYEHVDPDGVVHGKDGLRFIIVGFDGANLRFNTSEHVLAMAKARQAWIEDLGRRGIRCRIAFIRDRLPLGLSDEHTVPVMREIAAVWNESLPTALSTELYAILSIRDEKTGAQHLLDAMTITEGTMKPYGPWRMGAPGRPSPVEYLARQLAPISRPNAADRSPSTSLAQRLCGDAVQCDGKSGYITFTAGTLRKYAAVFVVEDWAGVQSEASMLDLLGSRFEMAVIHDFAPIAQDSAVRDIAYQARFVRTANPGSSMADQFDTVSRLLEKNAEDEQRLVRVQTTIIVYADDPAGLKEAYNRLLEYRGQGMNFAWTNWAALAHWLAQLPGYDDQARGMRLLSAECAVLTTLQATPTGRQDSDWGKGPIAIFETIDGSPYRFQFHADEGQKPPLGHFVMIAPSGGGKTTLATYLGGSALRHEDVKVIFLDRHRGCEVATRALGGKYLMMDGSGNVGLNPFQLGDTPGNRAFLRDWLALLANVKTTDYAMIEEIAEGVAIAYDKAIGAEWRNLRFLRESVFSMAGELRKRLVPWTNIQAAGALVCAAEDTLDLSSRLVGMELTKVLESDQLAGPVISYLFHRIFGEANGRPRLVFIDETEQCVRNEEFRPRYTSILQEGRKARIVVGSAFQRPNAPDELGIGTVIRGQCPTVFFFRNAQAQETDYAQWALNKQELDFVMGRTLAEHRFAVLLKRYNTGESVILNTDLRRLGKYLNIFNSGRGAAILSERLHAEYGDDFVPHYLAAA